MRRRRDARQPASHHDCADYLKSTMAGLGTEVTVTTAPPLVAGPYTVEPFRCPHGENYWIEPTGEQIATWAEEEAR